MIYKGTVSIVGDTGDRLPVNCEVTDHRLVIKTGDGSVIGDWGIRELSTIRTPGGFILRAEGENLLIEMQDSDSFMRALGAPELSKVADRISDARQSPDWDRARPLLAAGIAAGLLAALAVVLWATGTPPFERTPSVEVALVSVTTSTPPTTKAVTTTRPVTTTALSAADQRDLLRTLWLNFTSIDNGMLGYWNRYSDATYDSDWATMGAECKLGKSETEAWDSMFAIAPAWDPTLSPMIDAVIEETNLMFFWCSGGDRYAADAARPHQGVAQNLMDRVDAEFGIRRQ